MPAALLDLWDRCVAAPPRARARMLAAWASPGDPGDLAGRPLGEAQAELLRAWCVLRDTPLDAVADCPACDEALELAIEPEALPLAPSHRPRAVTLDNGQSVTPRLLTLADLEAVAGVDPGQGRVELARRALGVAEPSEDEQRAVAAVLEEADPTSSWWVALSCPSCANGWEEPLDLASFLWHAVDDAAARLLVEVSDLAAAFAWPEDAILALAPARRAAYLELAVR